MDPGELLQELALKAGGVRVLKMVAVGRGGGVWEQVLAPTMERWEA